MTARCFLALLTGAITTAAAPTFTRDIAPILFQNCSGCHRPGQGAPFSLLTFQDAARRAKQLADVTRQRLMPPWLPDPAYAHFEGERVLSPPQIQLLADWAAAGAPEGNPADLPPLPSWRDGWTLGEPDLVIQTPVFNLPAEGRDVYRNFVVPVPITATQYVAAVEFQPGNRTVAHHAFLRLDRTRASRDLDARDPEPGFDGMDSPPTAMSPDGHFLSWQPGKRPARNPDGLSWRLYPNSDLVLQMHMQTTGKPETIQSSIAFYFTPQPPTRFPLKIGLNSYKIDLPPGASNTIVTDSFTLPVDVDVMGVLPHAHYLGKDLQGFVRFPTGQTNWLIRIPDWNFNWQGDYRLKTPVFAPRGSVLTMRYSYDNSTNNPRNPNHPPQRVRYGVQTVDEMAELWLQVLPRSAGDLETLRRAAEKAVVESGIAFAEYRLSLNPNDARAHVKYGMSLMAMGREQEARSHFEKAAVADPADDQPHYYMGVMARARGLNQIATAKFQEAIRLNPKHAKAFGNLGLVHFEEGRAADAEKCFLRALELEANDAIAHDTLGVIYLRQRLLDKAERHFREAARLDPADAQVKAHLKILEGARR